MVRKTLVPPIFSYFHESMRGKSIIRAYQQETTVMRKQNDMMDKTVTQLFARVSSWNWY